MTQSILIGNPLQLTRKGILELHKLKNKETYCYVVRKTRGSSSLNLIEEEQFLHMITQSRNLSDFTYLYLLPFFIEPYDWAPISFEEHLRTNLSLPDTIKLESRGYTEALGFMDHWVMPDTSLRTDSELLRLHQKGHNKEYFATHTRRFVIPDDVKWDIKRTRHDEEYIQEKARTWG